jgi:hypothetical protein
MIRLFNGSTVTQNQRHFSTKRTFIPALRRKLAETDQDFCTCRVQCIPCLKLLTDEIGVDKYKNDFFTLFQNSVTGGSHKVFIIVNGVETEITDNTFGEMFNGVNTFGYRFDAYKVWQSSQKYGEFSAVIRNYNADNDIVQEKYSVCYRLMKYTDKTANGTIRIETRKVGKLRHGLDYSNLVQVASPAKNPAYWRQQVRLPGKLKLSGAPVELDRLMLNNNEQSSLQIMDKGDLEYDLSINLVSSEQIMDVLLDDLFANMVMVSDYNVYNFEKYRDVRLIRTGVELQPRVVKRKSFTFKMKRELSNIEKFND